MSAFPHYRSITSVPVSIETAHKLLEQYLEATKSSPYLLPNARLTASGPTTGYSNAPVKMYSLGRVEAGLRGEWLSPSVEAGGNNAAGSKTKSSTSNRADNTEMDGWQNLDEYQREQEVVEGEIGTHDTEVELEAKPSVIDKEARKKEKKLRMKEEKRRKAQSKEHAESEK
jgi:hypothetical protein